tara:strand:+ start:654 stop:1853 length:1200 start_codon:yes stop_codon:yes gene_type:complete
VGKKKLDSLKTNTINKNLNLALNWLTKSGIQNKNKNKSIEFGAYNAWYDCENKKYSYMYSEITGYLITSMVYHYKITKNVFYLTSAKNAADWLIRNAQDENGGFKCLFLINKKLNYAKKKNYIYSFDNGVIINGLVNLYNATKIQKYLKAAEKSADFLSLNFIKKNDEIRPVYDVKEKKFINNSKEWSLVSGSYHTKIAMGFLNLYKTTKKTFYLECGKKILKTYLKKQKKSGEFISTQYNTNLHPHCYSLEGYWSCGKFLKNKKFNSVSLKGIKWVLKNINLDGFPPRLKFKNNFNFVERIDILSQTLRLIVLHKEKLDLNKLDKDKIKKLIKNIMNNQKLDSKNPKIKGGFIWGKKSNGEKTNDVNAWVTAFAAQSLSILKDNRSNKILKSNPFYLV